MVKMIAHTAPMDVKSVITKDGQNVITVMEKVIRLAPGATGVFQRNVITAMAKVNHNLLNTTFKHTIPTNITYLDLWLVMLLGSWYPLAILGMILQLTYFLIYGCTDFKYVKYLL